MRNKVDSYIAALALALTMAACSAADETTNDGQKTADRDPISYTVATALTRTVISGSEFPVDKSFAVWAFKEADGQVVIDGDVVSCTDGTVWSTAEKYYWPEDSVVNFYALYPATLALNTTSLTFDYTVPATLTEQEDVLYDMATASRFDEKVARNSVRRLALPLTFHHALAQVAFKGKVSSEHPDWTVSVSDIAVCRVCSAGTYSLTSQSWIGASAPADYHIGIRTDAGAFSYDAAAEATNLTADDGALLVIPQELTAWDLTTAVDATAGSYLAVTCHVSNATDDLIGSAAAPQTVYVPFDNTATPWQQGHKYVYTLQFGSGYDASGRTSLQVLVLSADITDWADGTGGDLGAKMTNE